MSDEMNMDTRSDNDIVIEYTVRLERLLRSKFGATGTGLGTLISSIGHRIPESLIKEGRRLAAMRNRVVHEHVPLDNRSEFIRRCERLEKRLLDLADQQEASPKHQGGVYVNASMMNKGPVIKTDEGVLSVLFADRFYWPLVTLALIFSALQIQHSFTLYNPSELIKNLADLFPEHFATISVLNIALVLFVKNFSLLRRHTKGLSGMIGYAIFSALISPLMLASMIFSASILGSSIAAYLLGYNLYAESYPHQGPYGFHALGNYESKNETLAHFSLASQAFILGFLALIYYGLSIFYRLVFKKASGHATSAIVILAVGYAVTKFNPLWLVPLVWLAAVDLWRVGKEGNIMAWPKDLLRVSLSNIHPTQRNQRDRREAQQGGRESENESVRSPFEAEVPRYNFSHVVGMSDLKNRLGAAGKEFLQSRRTGIASRNGILLYGPPGTGKTFFAEALAGELKLKIIKANFGQTASRWVNQTTEQVMAVFREAEKQAPVVLFMDEIDTLLIDRSKVTNADSESARLVSAFLPAIERLRARGVLVIGATNLLDQLDPAAIREGRFDFKIEVPYPDDEARLAILKERVIKAGVTVYSETLQRLSKRWSGFSVARLHAIVDEVARMDLGDVATFDDFMAALRTVQGRKGARGDGGPTLEQLTLPPRLREELMDIANRMKNIDSIERLGGSLPRGILFFGPPGTGKTYTARALANSADWAFIVTTGHDLLANPKKIDEIMRDASDMRPCIVFIDEADDVFGHRGFSNAANITNKLLTAMDGAQGRVPDVVFIAATNHPDNFDPAALRGGRFTEKVEFELPDRQTLIAHIQKWMRSAKVAIHGEVTAESVSDLVLGQPLATVDEILQAAVNRMASRVTAQNGRATNITMEDIREGVRRVAGGSML